MRMRPRIAAIGTRAAQAPETDYADALLAGLSSQPKFIPCKFFYDAEGSRLFEQICTLPEYYPTRVELGLLNKHAAEMAALIGPDAEIVEYGAGAAEKIRPLLRALHTPQAYVPIDISGPYLQEIAQGLRSDFPALAIRPLVADFTREIVLPPSASKRAGYFPGSTIGNFDPEEARAFLAKAARTLRGGGLLIGVDLVKDPTILHAAYNDGAGVTAAFNKNLLARANREIGAAFDLTAFSHYAIYNPILQRIEMYLISRRAQRVAICGEMIAFSEGEAIHTESSHKYTIDGFRTLAVSAGFTPRAVWRDPENLFSIHWLEAA